MHDRDSAPIDDCWNRIGVRGDRSCPRLAEHIHCRECPVHEAAAKTLLYRAQADTGVTETAAVDTGTVHAGAVPTGTVHTSAMPAAANTGRGYTGATQAAAATGATARADASQAAGTDTISLLIFRLHAEWLALPVAALAEVTPLRAIHSLPRRAGVVLGVCNVRGRLVPCVSLTALLDLAPRHDTADDTATPRMLVLATRGGTIVAPVDEVAGIHPYPLAAIGPLPDTLAGGHYAAGVVRYRERTVGLLDGPRLAHAIEGKLA